MTKLDAKNMPAKELCARLRESTDTALAVSKRNWRGTLAWVNSASICWRYGSPGARLMKG